MTLYTDISPECCAVLEARVADGSLPPGDVLCSDVRSLDAAALARAANVHLFFGMGGSPLGLAWAGWPPEWSIVTGGFPCQDISSAGKGAGLDGARSGLFWELCRVISIKQPMGVIAENVGALSARGLDRVAGALESLGYWVEALRLGAWAVGSPQERERWWFVCRRADCGQAMDWTGGERLEAIGHGGDQLRGPGARRESGAGGEGSELAIAGGGGRGIDQPGRRPQGRAAAGRAGARGQLADFAGEGARRLPEGSGRPDEAACEPARPSQSRQLADVRVRGQGTVWLGGAGSVADQPGAGVGVADPCGERSSHAQTGERPTPAGTSASASDPRRWPHPRWCVIDADGRDRTIPTPQYEWEPCRLYPGTRTISAQWRLALMGYPLHWLDVPQGTLDVLTKHRGEQQARWWNKRGIEMTGNAQCPQNVAVLARAAIDAAREAVAA